MNGFADHNLDEGAFGEKKGFSEGLRTFDAFPKTKPTYTRRSSTGGYTTLLLILISTVLSFTELRRWYSGHETHLFSVEKGVSHELQINLDIVIPMLCSDLNINVQDASGDRILAGDLLTKDATNWRQWVERVNTLERQGKDLAKEQEEDTHVGHVLGHGREKRRFKKTPRLGRGMPGTSCRVYGSLEGNKVQGDFHITARGHGYMEFGQHLDHSAFNFSHIINELSFGPLYPSLLNPLDKTYATTGANFYKYQYYLSVVPTIYTRTPSPKTPSAISPSNMLSTSSDTIITNQYAVTSQSHDVNERSVPGIFFKFDIEPILLTIREERGGLLALCVRVVNVVSGILVGGGWCYQLAGWGREVLGGRKRGEKGGMGMLHGGNGAIEEEEE
ncbi:hypothetical protein HO133_002066 [Letharia lupina]|uniref:Endoplasmic reticulum-Golgi intermediate compartment protein n=1 Tax=Letharia lupina TaxID=560253 RepID=A0A8H6FAR5_9LECA|nr:uncharacterized protein HO133_002066 [Letharia lupina]KAF6221211.1 hypothetical protein HO133_002066 [Letharia lupina]